MFKIFSYWMFLSAFLFCGFNFFVSPRFPQVHQYLGTVLSMWSAIGASGIVLGALMLFGKVK